MAAKSIARNKPNQRVYSRVRPYVIGMAAFLALLVTFVGILVLVTGRFQWEFLFGTGFILLMLGLALFDSLAEMSEKKRFWGEAAQRAGLTCQVGNFFLGFPVQVFGTYRERKLKLSTFKQGKGQIPSTRLEVSVENPAKASLRLRGPFGRKQAMSDKGVTDLFSATDARQFGDDLRFFIRSSPVHLVTGMFKSGPLKDNLLQLKPLVNIELEGQKLYFEQIGIIEDVDYLHFLFDLLIDIADTIDRGGYVKLTTLGMKIK